MVDNSDIFQSQRQCFCLCLVQRIPHPLAVKQMEQIKEMYVMWLGINKNSFGLKTSPWGTPHLALVFSDPVEAKAKVSCCSSQLPALTGVLLAQLVHFYLVHICHILSIWPRVGTKVLLHLSYRKHTFGFRVVNDVALVALKGTNTYCSTFYCILSSVTCMLDPPPDKQSNTLGKQRTGIVNCSP